MFYYQNSSKKYRRRSKYQKSVFIRRNGKSSHNLSVKGQLSERQTARYSLSAKENIQWSSTDRKNMKTQIASELVQLSLAQSTQDQWLNFLHHGNSLFILIMVGNKMDSISNRKQIVDEHKFKIFSTFKVIPLGKLSNLIFWRLQHIKTIIHIGHS